MGKLFVGSDERIRTYVYIDFSGRFAKAIAKPDRDFLIVSGAVTNLNAKQREEFFQTLEKQYEESIKRETVKREWMEWKYWTYSLRRKIEREAQVMDPVTRDITYDPDKLNEGKIKYLLLDWSFVDEEGKKISLERKDDKLTDESLKKVLSLDPSVLLVFIAELNKLLYLSREEEKN